MTIDEQRGGVDLLARTARDARALGEHFGDPPLLILGEGKLAE